MTFLGFDLLMDLFPKLESYLYQQVLTPLVSTSTLSHACSLAIIGELSEIHEPFYIIFG